ncbi:6591_t:CDS:2, partial [Gigaspora rosea]
MQEYSPIYQLQIPTDEGVQIKYILNNGWKVILGGLDNAQANGLGVALADLNKTKGSDKERVAAIFQIKRRRCISAGDNTNVAESAHADAIE